MEVIGLGGEIRTPGPHYPCAVTGAQDQRLKPNSPTPRYYTNLYFGKNAKIYQFHFLYIAYHFQN